MTVTEVWPADRALAVNGKLEHPTPSAAPGTYPVPAGRGRWRVSVHNRQFDSTVYARDTILSELTDARSRRLVQQLNQPATFTFTVDGHSAGARWVQELTTDVIAWRWDDQTGRDVCMFRGPVCQSQDTLSEQTAVVNFTCHDYLAMVGRRFPTQPTPTGWTGTWQDQIAWGLVYYATYVGAGSGTPNLFTPGSFLPLWGYGRKPDGSPRTFGDGGPTRDRFYPGQQNRLDALTQLAACDDGFDFDVAPGGNDNTWDQFRIWYPYQGVQRDTPQLMYGTTVRALTRSFNSMDFANYYRLIGNNQAGGTNAPQMYAERWTADASSGQAGSAGFWARGDQDSDVSVQQTLNDHCQGNLNRSSVVVPSYTLKLRPDAYAYGSPNMGDVVPLIVQEGRLNVNTYVRILGLDYDVGDDGQEDVNLTVGRPDTVLTDLFNITNANVNALARR